MTKNPGNSTDDIKIHHLLLLIAMSIVLGAMCLFLAAVAFSPSIGGQAARLAPALMKSTEDYPVPDLPPAPSSGSVVTVTVSPSGRIIGESTHRIVAQGDLVRVGEPDAGHCTIGYVERATAVAYTAGHCGDDGASAFNEHGDAIGVFRHSPSYTGDIGPGDVGYVLLDDGVEIGTNHYSGDAVVTSRITESDQVCVYGATSKKITCGEFIAHRNDTVGLVHINVPVIPGDSGGPVWIPGRGVIGTTSFSHDHGRTPLPVTGVSTIDPSAVAAAAAERITAPPPTR